MNGHREAAITGGVSTCSQLLAQRSTERNGFQREPKLTALYADPANYEAHLVAAAAAEKIDRYDLAIVILKNAQLHAPQELHPKIDQAISRCERMKTFGEKKIAADKAFASGKRKEAAEGYLLAWGAAPERVDSAVSGVQAAVIAEDYSKARIILTKLQASGTPAERLPAGLRDIPDLMVRLDNLQAYVGTKAQKSSGKSSIARRGKKGSAGSSGNSKKTMADDFLSRIKK